MLNKDQTILVYRADDFFVAEGVAWADPLRCSDDLILDDVYQFKRDAFPTALHITHAPDGSDLCIADTQTRLLYDACLSLMTADGALHQVITFKSEDRRGRYAICFMPLSDLDVTERFRLIDINTNTQSQMLTLTTWGSFGMGTKISMANGLVQAIEDLKVGDLILTRDHGPLPIRAIGHNTVRAQGQFAPVVIKKGAIGNSDDLVVRPDHRLFVNQRNDLVDLGRSEVLIRAKHLIDGDSIYQMMGGYVDYVQVTLEENCVLYAHGVCAESQLISKPRPTLSPPAVLPQQNIYAEQEMAAINDKDLSSLLRRA